MASSPAHVIIMGAGPTGITAAIALAQLASAECPVRVTVLEIRDRPVTIGGSINLTPLALRYLEGLDVLVRPRGLAIEDGPDFVSQRTGSRLATFHSGSIRIKREHLSAALLDRLRAVIDGGGHAEVQLRFGVQVVAIEEQEGEGQGQGQGGGITVVLDQGDRIRGDVLLGCDGLHSFVRTSYVDPARQKVFSGQAAAYAYLPLGREGSPSPPTLRSGEPATRTTSLVMSMHGRLIMSYFEPTRSAIWVAAVTNMAEPAAAEPTDGEDQGDAAARAREGWRAAGQDQERIRQEIVAKFSSPSLPGSAEFLAACRDWHLFPIYILPPGGRWARGRALLLGDAAHAGESTGIAIEDAVLFAHVFSRRDSRPIGRIFDDYEALRRRDVDRIYRQTIRRFWSGEEHTWLKLVLLEWLIILFAPLMRLRYRREFARDVRQFELPA